MPYDPEGQDASRVLAFVLRQGLASRNRRLPDLMSAAEAL